MYTINLNGNITFQGGSTLKLYETPVTASMHPSGLLLHLDASLKESYPGSGSLWYDISGNGYFASASGATFINSHPASSWAFDGVNDYMTSSYAIPLQSLSSAFTWNIWCHISASDQDPLVGYRGTTLEFIKLNAQTFQMYPDQADYTSPLNMWINLCAVKTHNTYPADINGVTDNDLIIYSNGIFYNHQSVATFNGPHPFYIGGDPTANEYSTSKIAAVGVYDRALRPEEVMLNFELMKRRFGYR